MSGPIGHLAKLARKAVEPIAIKALLARERLESGVSYHPGSAEILADPYPKYAQMRQRDPVHRMRLLDGWALTRYKDCDAVLRDHARFSNAIPSEVREQAGLISMLHQDPPEHTRLRALVSQAFTPRAIEKLRFRVEQTAEQLLDAVAGQPSFDLIASLAYPLPITIIADLMGVPPKDMDRFKDWSNDLALSVEPFLPKDAMERVGGAAEELTEYFEAIIAVRRQEPRDDLISVLLAAEEEGSKLTHDELIKTLMLLLVAGNETTRNLIGNGMLALLSNPDQLQRLRHNPDLLNSAVKELLRYDPPVQLDGRVVRQDVEIGGKHIRAGQLVISLIGAANHDPAVFEQPDVLDIGRKGTSHLSFGRGIHYCLGASLAEMEGRIAFKTILRRFRSMRLAGEPKRREQISLRGVEELWVEVEVGADG